MAPPGESSKQNGAKGKGRDKGKGAKKPLVKTNKAKRERIDNELKELQSKIDNFVSIELARFRIYQLTFPGCPE